MVSELYDLQLNLLAYVAEIPLFSVRFISNVLIMFHFQKETFT